MGRREWDGGVFNGMKFGVGKGNLGSLQIENNIGKEYYLGMNT